MVVVIIGILGAVAIPQFLKAQEKARMSEALTILASIRSSQARYYGEREGSYSDVLGGLDFDPTSEALMGTHHFTFGNTCTGGCGAGFTATATRNGTAFHTNSGCTTGYQVTVNHNGAWTGRDCRNGPS